MNPLEQRVKELEREVEDLKRFNASLHNPSQYNADLVQAMSEAVFGTINLNDLNDVNTAGVTNNQVIKYSTGSQTWTPANDLDT